MTAKPEFAPIAGLKASDADIDLFAQRRRMPVIQPMSPHDGTDGEPSVQGRVTVELPLYLIEDLRVRGFQQRCSARHLIMHALQTDGYKIEAEDLVSDRRRCKMAI